MIQMETKTETIHPKIKKITFNCPEQVFKKMDEAMINGHFSSRTDLILTSLRSYLGIT